MALKVLLADDSVPAQNMGKKILADAGYEVLAVSNGLEALKKIADSVPDIAILDIFMPGYTGLEVCSRLRANAVTAELPVILTVGKLEPYRPEEGEKVRSNAVIVKPFASEELLSAVRSLVGLPFAMRPDTPEVKAPAAQAPVVEAAPEDDYVEEAPMLTGFGFDGAPSAPASGVLGWDPDSKRSAFSASAVEEPVLSAEVARAPGLDHAAPAVYAAVAAPALNDFQFQPEAKAAGASASPALVEWWQASPDALEKLDSALDPKPALSLESLDDEATPAVSVHTLEDVLAAEWPTAVHRTDALDELAAEAYKQAAIAAPEMSAGAEAPRSAAAEKRQAPAPAPSKVEEDSAELHSQSAADLSLPDRESRMQAFEELFNSEVTIPVEETPPALLELLAAVDRESFEEAEKAARIAPKNDIHEAFPIAAAGSAAMHELDTTAEASGELRLDTDSVADWLTTGKVPQPQLPQTAAALHSTTPTSDLGTPSPAQAGRACDSFYAGIPEAEEHPPTGAREATPPIICDLPKEPGEESPQESSVYVSPEPAETEFAHAETVTADVPVTPDVEDPQVETPQPVALCEDEPKPQAGLHATEEAAQLLAEIEPATGPELLAETDPARQASQETAEAQGGAPSLPDDGRLATDSEPEVADTASDAKRVHQAVESVFERFRPLLIAAIARELTKRD